MDNKLRTALINIIIFLPAVAYTNNNANVNKKSVLVDISSILMCLETPVYFKTPENPMQIYCFMLELCIQNLLGCGAIWYLSLVRT